MSKDDLDLLRSGLVFSTERLTKKEAQKREERWFRGRDLSLMHSQNKSSRLKVLEAFKRAVGAIFSRLPNQEPERVLEVGCGIDFLRQYLLPEQVKKRTISFDISPFALNEVKERERTIQASAYHVPVGDCTFDWVTGLSAFDSLEDLEQAVAEASRCLRKDGHLLLIQDVRPDLYQKGSKPDISSNVAYHRALVRAVKNQGLEVTAGEDEFQEETAIVPSTTIAERVDPYFSQKYPDFPRKRVGPPFFIGVNFGEEYVGPSLPKETQKAIREGREEVNCLIRFKPLLDQPLLGRRRSFEERYLQEFQRRFSPRTDLSKVQPEKGKTIQWVRVGFLIAEKRR